MNKVKKTGVLSERFWEASLEELKKGYIEDPQAGQLGGFIILIDGEIYEKGHI